MTSTTPIHDRAVILSSGDEIITGQLLDTNSRWLADQLVQRAILPIEHITVPDDLPALVGALRRACALAPLVVMSGGLGPTEGDLTRQALAEVMGEGLVPDPMAEGAIAGLLAARGREMTERQRRQALRPASAVCLPNLMGTAPGLHGVVKVDGAGHAPADVICLPGPPGELRPMWERAVLGLLRPDPARTIITRLLHVVGVPEADCVQRLGDLTRRDRPTHLPLVGITASGGILTLRIRSSGSGGRAEGERFVDADVAAIRAVFGDHQFAEGAGVGYEVLARGVIDTLRQRAESLATVESCTGGMLGEIITTVPGASRVYLGGYVTYANAMKEALGVSAAALKTHGAVSAEVAREMATAGLERTGASWCLSITGIAGPPSPGGATPQKPVGTVHIGMATRPASGGLHATTRRFLFSGDRQDIRRRSCVSALAILHFALRGHAPRTPRLLWEV